MLLFYLRRQKMPEQTSSIISKVWGLCNPLRDDGVSYGDYLEQLTYLIFLKMSDEYSKPPYKKETGIPAGYTWQDMNALKGAELEEQYKVSLEELGKAPSSDAANEKATFVSCYDLNANINAVKKMTPAQETHVNLAAKYIMDHYKEPIDVDSICNEIGFSKYYFCKIFKKQQGQTIHQYLNDYRIKNAKELLAYSKLSVNTIATQVGYKNNLTFIRAFERTVNMTPSEYRSYYQ